MDFDVQDSSLSYFSNNLKRRNQLGMHKAAGLCKRNLFLKEYTKFFINKEKVTSCNAKGKVLQ